MKTNKEHLMKHFASVLRNRALGKQTETGTSKNLAFYFSRKELIEILKKKFEGTIPKQHNLIEMENEELLELIGDEMYIIAFVTDKWSKEPLKTNNQKVAPKTTTVPAKKHQNKNKDDAVSK